MKKTSLNILFVLLSISTFGQGLCDTLSFINCKKNIIQLSESDQIKIRNDLKSGELRIVHIGDSHLQAAFFTEKVKQQLNEYFQKDSQIASSGFIFPFSIAQTNNPFFFTVEYSGVWNKTKNVDELLNAPIGLSGITIFSKSPEAKIKIRMENQKYKFKSKYFFDQVVLLHNIDSLINILANDIPGEKNKNGTRWKLDSPVDSIQFTIHNTDTAKSFELYGIILEKRKSLVQYHTIGINGSMAKSYLRCTLFDNHLQLLNPNLVIISLGTNEAYGKDFTKEDFILNFTNLISRIHNSMPDAVIIIATPNDHIKDGLTNKNVEVVRESIYQLKTYFSFGIWDFYEIMGGTESISEWHKRQLAAEDRLHFNRKGYEIQGGLFFNALINLFNNK